MDISFAGIAKEVLVLQTITFKGMDAELDRWMKMYSQLRGCTNRGKRMINKRNRDLLADRDVVVLAEVMIVILQLDFSFIG